VCPLTTGIFLRIIAEAAEEFARAGGETVAPYWRVVRDDGAMIEKFPGGAKAQARRLAAEGIASGSMRPKAIPKVISLAEHLYRFV
jgi:alkylated DNA nucleotide flippase Atl1